MESIIADSGEVESSFQNAVSHILRYINGGHNAVYSFVGMLRKGFPKLCERSQRLFDFVRPKTTLHFHDISFPYVPIRLSEHVDFEISA